MGGEHPEGAGRSGFPATLKSQFARLRKAACDRQNFSREEMILQEFAFLERDFDCSPPDIRRDPFSLTVIWAAAACRVAIVDDVREGFDVLVLPGLDGPGGFQYGILAIKHYREHGDLEGCGRAARARKRPWAFREELAQNAAWVREHAADILRGDPSLFQGFDEASRRVREAMGVLGAPQAREG